MWTLNSDIVHKRIFWTRVNDKIILNVITTDSFDVEYLLLITKGFVIMLILINGNIF